MLFFYIFLLFILFIIYSSYNKNVIHSFFKYILFYFNYKVDNNINEIIENLPNKVIFISSHTSIYDFIVGMCFYYAYFHYKYSIYILMKKEFEKYLKNIMYLFDRKIKLISVKPVQNSGLTQQIIENIRDSNDNFLMFIAPEGTRKCTDTLRSGYWVISKELNIPVVYIGIDFALKTITIENKRNVMENWENEQLEFIKTCKKYIPMYPDRCYWTKDYYN